MCVCMLVCLLFVFLIDLVSGGVLLIILLPVHRVFYRFVFLEGVFLIDLVFGAYGAHFVRLLRPKSAKREPNRTQMGPKRQNYPQRAPKRSQMSTRGGQDHPRDVSREGSANRVAKKTLRRVKVPGKWVQNGTIFGAMWCIFGLFFRCFFKVVF